MNNVVPMPQHQPPAVPSVFGRLVPRSIRSRDANAFAIQAQRMRNFLGIGALTGAMSASPMLVIGATQQLAETSLISFCVCMMGTAVIMLFTPPDTPTRALPPGMDAKALPMLVREMIRITETGLADRDRARVQQLVDDASEQIRLTLGVEAWTLVADPRRSGPGIYVDGVRLGREAGPESLGRRGVAIAKQLPVIDGVMQPTGTDPAMLGAAIAHVAGRIASICADFGLDPAGFAERERILPGMRARAIERLPDLDADARRLAEEWMGGDREGIDPMIRIDADRAAGQELETLSRAWERARASATPDTLEKIDADMRDGCRRICATLSAAIGARGRSDRDALGTQSRYLEAKHGDDTPFGEA